MHSHAIAAERINLRASAEAKQIIEQAAQLVGTNLSAFMLNQSYEAALRIIQQLVRRVRDAEDQVELMLLKDTQTKIVSALLKLAGSGAAGVELSISPVDLSARVGLDVDTVKRSVARLREQSYVRIVGERVEIPDVDALRRLYALLGSKEELRGGA